MTLEQAHGTARTLPGVSESTTAGVISFCAGGRLFLRVRDAGETLVLRTDFYERKNLLATAPWVYFVTPQIVEHPWVFVRLADADAAQITALIRDAWRRVAPKRSIQAFDAD